MKTLQVVLMLAVILPVFAQPDSFDYSVFRVRLARDEPGRLRIGKEGLEYRAEKAKTAFRIPLKDVHKIDASEPRLIRVETYDRLAREFGGRREYTFRLREKDVDEYLVRFLDASVQRSVIGVFPSSSPPIAGIEAYHRHRLGGCPGTINIDGDAIRFISGKAGESRTWRYQDIETIGTMNAFHLRISTLAETYNFDLKERLSTAEYEAISKRVYALGSSSPHIDARRE